MPTRTTPPTGTARSSTTRTATAVVVALVGALAAGCASNDPWLAPRGSLRGNLDQGPTSPPVSFNAQSSNTRASAPRPSDFRISGAVSVAGGSSELAELNRVEERLRAQSLDLQTARGKSIALASALQTYQSQPSEHHRQVAEDAIRAYQGSPAVRKLGAVALAFSLAACNSINSQINSLNSEERDLSARLAEVDTARKANIALVSALQQVQRDGGAAKSKAAAAKARAAYDAALSKL